MTLLFSGFFNWNSLTTYFTYILRCADSTLYTGITTDIDRRIREHNTDNKKGAKYTRVRRPVELIYNEGFETRSEACKREYAIKHMTRDEKLTLSEQSS